MVSVSKTVEGMIEIETIIEKTYTSDISLFYFPSKAIAIISDANLSKFRERMKNEFEVSYKSYSADEMLNEEKGIIATNDEFGFNLLMIRNELKKFEFDEIFMPDKEAPAFIKLGDGFNSVIAPYNLRDGIDRGNGALIKAKKSQKSLSAFW